MIRNIGGDSRCFDCLLPDCEPSDRRCPLNKTAGNGTPMGARRNKKYEGVAPSVFTGRADYQRRYNAEYNRRFRRVVIPGLKIRRCDFEVLEAASRKRGRTLAEDIVAVLEDMATQARTAMSAGKSL